MKVRYGHLLDSPIPKTSTRQTIATRCNTIFTLCLGTRYPVLTLAQI